MSFGTKLKMIRIENKLDQNAMSELLHVSQPVYSRYENDEKDVNENSPFVIAVAEAFNKSTKWLVAPDNKNKASFENNGFGNGLSFAQKEINDLIVPKAFMDALLNPQKMTLEILQILAKK